MHVTVPFVHPIRVTPGEPTLLRMDAAGIAGVGTPAGTRPTSLVLRVDPARSPLPGAELLPAGTLVGGLTIEAVGTKSELDASSRFAHATRINAPGCVLLPGLVNAHSHLDLTHIGPVVHDASQGFGGFIRLVMSQRLSDPTAIERSVHAGARLLLQGGVVATGDISGVVNGLASHEAFAALAKTPLLGTGFVEFFAIGAHERSGLAALGKGLDAAAPHATPRVTLGCSPHAPYTVSPRAFAAAVQLCEGRSRGMAMHLAEHMEEREFIARGVGPLRAFHERTGAWDAGLAALVGAELSPIAHMHAPLLRAAARGVRVLAVHVNDCAGEDQSLFARSGAALAYCPRASEYFGHAARFGTHPYRELSRAGIRVALGTDSIINLPHGAERISTLDEARLLLRRDDTDAASLIEMITTHGAGVLGLDPAAFAWTPAGPIAGVVAVPIADTTDDPARAVLTSDAAPRLLALSAHSHTVAP